MSGQRSEAELAERWNTIGVNLATVRMKAGGTILPQRGIGPEAAATIVSRLPALLKPTDSEVVARLELGPPLGEGGMGIVRVARQRALERDVAVKCLRSDVDAALASPQLLREARVTGAIEHPNVVPVYDLGRDDSQRPLLVMKRVEGTSWEDLIAQDRQSKSFAQHEYLTRHLGILSQVTNAVHFAHARRVLHRDIKPENVMIGGFGEVYVVDWGIAVCLGAESIRGLPRARDIDEIAGSPGYMAPEMAAGDGASFDERTDVYLLGATLHHIITGDPPHGGWTLRDCLLAAFASKPHEYGEDVPSGLVAICHRAMAPLPEDRYPDAAAFGEAISSFLTHRSSTMLSDEAKRKLRQVQIAVAEVDPANEQQVQALYMRFSECRFAFSQALRSWDGNADARTGLQRVLELMIGHELEHGSAGAAAALLPDLPAPQPELAAKVEAARQAERQTEAELGRLQREADLSLGGRLRGILTAILSISWSVLFVALGLLRALGIYPVGHREIAGLSGLYACVLLTASYLARRTLRANEANRRVTTTITLLFVFYTLLWPLAYVLDVPVATTALFHALLGTAYWLISALNVDRDWLPSAAGLFLALCAVLLWPSLALVWLGAGGGLGATAAGIIRLRRAAAEAAPQ